MTNKKYDACVFLIKGWSERNFIKGFYDAFANFLSLDQGEISVVAKAIIEMRNRKDQETFHGAMCLVLSLWASQPGGVNGLIAISNLIRKLPSSDVQLLERIDTLFPPSGTALNSLYRPPSREAFRHPYELVQILSTRLTTGESSYVEMLETASRYLAKRHERFSE